MKKTFLLTLMIGVMGFTSNIFAETIEDIVAKADAAMKAVKTCSYDFYSKERFKGGKVISSYIQFKIQESPVKKTYANSIEPQKAQLVYIPSVQSKVKVKKGFTLNLELTNGLLMKEQHQTIDRAGFGRIRKVLMTSIDARKGQDLDKFAKITGSVNYDGKDCYRIEINDPDYKIILHTVTPTQTSVWKLRDQLAIPKYKIKELNGLSKDELTPGQKIKIPSSYAKKTIIYLDKKTYLPLYQRMEDAEGMYETYEMKNLKIGVSLTDADFQF